MARRRAATVEVKPDEITIEPAEPEVLDKAPDDETIAYEWAKKTRLEVLACRQFGHQWTRGLSTLYKIDNDLHARVLCCNRCGMERTDFYRIGWYGVWKRHYEPPKDYSRKTGIGGSVKIPRYVVAEEVDERSEVSTKLPEHVRELYNRWSRSL